MKLLLSTVAVLTLTSGLPAVASPMPRFLTETNAEFQVAQRDRAEQTCVDAAEDQGLQVLDVRRVNPYSGGTEVILNVRRNRGSSYTIGCDYASSTRQVELYRIEQNDTSSSNDDFNDDLNDSEDWRALYRSDRGVRNNDDAEEIAREVVGEQLGIADPDSDIVEIDTVRRESQNRLWMVEGRANGAAFVVRIRAADGYIQDFQLY